MLVVPGQFGKETVHFEAPLASQVTEEMERFLRWIEEEKSIDPVLKAGIAHFWFVTIPPFDDGNGCIERAIADLLLARSEKSSCRFYSLSAQIQKERKRYYACLEEYNELLELEFLLAFLAIHSSDNLQPLKNLLCVRFFTREAVMLFVTLNLE